jgi:hypothetical protein
VTIAHQPDSPGADLPSAPGSYLAYLDVWQRHLTGLEDPEILEVALGGPDTCTRVKAVWQIKWVKVTEAGATCGSQVDAFARAIAPSTGRLTARARPAADRTDDPCLLGPGAGYRRLENQLYRVEIHEVDPQGVATFKWSRDNGSVVTAWIGQSGNDLAVRSTGKDSVLAFTVGNWVELTDDTHELAGLSGPLVKIVAVQGETITIDPGTAVVDFAAFPSRPKMRRWDMGASGALAVDVPDSNDGFIELEDGVDVKFEPGTFRAGDYWLVPARTSTADVDWPFNESQLPQGIAHHYSRLAILSFDGNQYTSVSDCRKLFPAVTELTSLFYLGGDGQEGAPGQTLPQSLQVGVANGQWPVPGATVRFAVTGGGGSLQTEVATLDVLTDADGVARCDWKLGGVTQGQQVEARLLDSVQQSVHLPVHFSASFSEDAHDLGIQIEKLLLGDGSSLNNDADVSFDRLTRGIDVLCSANLAAGTVSRATCFLTLEVPFPITGSDAVFWGANLIGYQPLVLAADTHSQGAAIAWRPAPAVVEWLKDSLFSRMAILNRAPRVLARLTILGNFIWQAGKPNLFLDGEVFGMRASSDAPSSVRGRLPSGDGRRGGRLEMWFWVVPPITISISPEEVRLPFTERARLAMFTVSIDGSEDTRVEMSVNGVVGGSAAVGTITLTDQAQGTWTYRAPSTPPTIDQTFVIGAASVADPSRVARAVVIVKGRLGLPDIDLGDVDGQAKGGGGSSARALASRRNTGTESPGPAKLAPRAAGKKRGRREK